MGLTHFDDAGNAIMVDVGDKPETRRQAIAKGSIAVSRECFEAIQSGTARKGDVLGTARIAGIMAAKRTAELIPLCHTIPITKAAIDFTPLPETNTITATCTIRTTGQTGVEMEALTGVSVALLTVYDMCKAIDRHMEIGGIYLEEKTGGQSGTVRRADGDRS